MIGTRLTAQGVQDYWRRIVDECSREIAELPNNPLRYYKRAQAYKELGNLELALGDLTRVIDLIMLRDNTCNLNTCFITMNQSKIFNVKG